MGIVEPETLRGLKNKNLDVFAYCNRCHHNAVVPIAVLLAKLGPGHAVPAVDSCLVCSSCGSKDIGTRPHWPDNIGVPAHHGTGD